MKSTTQLKSFLAVMMMILTVGSVRTDTIITDFSTETTLGQTGLTADVPNASVASVTLDAANDRLVLAANDANMWNSRDNAPIAWVAKPTTAQTVVLRMEVEEGAGAGGSARYTFKYDLLGGAGMQTLTTYDSWVDNSRVGVFMKTDGAADAYFNTLEVAPEPATMSLLALGGIAMLKRRKK